MVRDEISEYPYSGVITRISEDDDVVMNIYEGVMDEHMVSDSDGRTLKTSPYIISIPLTKDDSDKYIVPRSGDVISLERYGENLEFTVENVEPSQLGGISIYAIRKGW